MWFLYWIVADRRENWSGGIQHTETFVGKLGTQIRVSPSEYHMVDTLKY